MPKGHLNRQTRLEWSYSRSSLLRSCPRAFFFSEVQAPNQIAGHRPLPLRAVVGIAVHRAIASEITTWASGGKVSLARAQATAALRLEEDLSQHGTRVMEVVNGMQLPSNIGDRLAQTARARLRTFFRMLWPHFSRQIYVMHERRDSFDLGEIRVWVQVDLATRTGEGDLVISDWKTGATLDPEIEELQMGIYALWANVGLGEDPSRILTQLVNLRTGQIVRRAVDSGLLLRMRALIDAEAHSAVPPIRKARFKPNPSLEKCSSCLFLRLCADGKDEVAGYRGSGWTPPV